MAVALTAFQSVEGLLGHLDDTDDNVIESSLEALLELIPYHWAEIADKLSDIEELSEDDQFPFKKKASLLASKIFFSMGSYEDSLRNALAAGDEFDIKEDSDYVQKLTEQCIDSYRTYMQLQYKNTKEKQVNNDDDDDDDNNDDDNDIQMDNNNSSAFDQRKIKIVEDVLNYCYTTGDFKHAIGIAIECRRIDHVQKAINLSDDKSEMLSHTFTLCETVINSRTFRDEVLNRIVLLYADVLNSNYNTICRCYFYLDSPQPISDILWKLININNDKNSIKELTAYQIAFDLTEYQNDAFLRGIFNNIPKPPIHQLKDTNTTDTNTNTPANDNTPTTGTGTGTTGTPATTDKNDNDWDKVLLTKWKRLRGILLGTYIIPLTLDFLFRNSCSDLLILKKIKDGISERNSVLNNSLICCNGIMHCGTTIDQFLRDNLEWMGHAAHWCKFTATASVGMIHNKHIRESMNVLQRYLPGSGGGPYQEGGSLYALGLIHVGDNSDITCIKIRKFLLKNLKSASNEILQHGSCLGLGLAALGFGTQSGDDINNQNDDGDDDDDDDDDDNDDDNDNDQQPAQQQPQPQQQQQKDDNGAPTASEILTEIRDILFQDRAVPGEAAGLSLGLILCGSGNKQWYSEMLAYAHETSHEKIIRGLVMGISIIFYNLQEQAEYAISTLISDKLDTIRYGGCYTIGLAYCCTSSTLAISKLLHLAVSDVSSDVRRAAVTNIGFVLANNPSSVPKVVQLLANSYNCHVRYGAAAALGIACAGTGNNNALSLLKLLAEDAVDYVRQAALISIGMLLMEHNSIEEAQVDDIRSKYFHNKIIDKRESTMCKMGAILGSGIIDASGRNTTISLYNNLNNTRKQLAIIGMAIFWQYWYWYPLIPFITLCFKPTMIMILNKQLNMVKCNIKSTHLMKNKFKYVENLKEEKKNQKKKLIKVDLSVAAKTKQRRKLLKNKTTTATATKTDDNNDVNMTDTTTKTDDIKKKDKDNSDNKMDIDDDKKDADIENILPNPSRVTPNQIKYIQWINKRYKPLTLRLSGIVMVEDTKPDQQIELVKQKTISSGGVYGDEPDPPKPFLYLGI